ncbi:hypothetical protein [Edwardsiella tarda]|uniref:hypothetical protein n=1 Tax=Edwardsiella tarda TaxID=636 RepID=UPI00351C00D0
MSSLIIMVVMACGFWYTDNHYPSRLRYARTHGWSSYFYIAMQGCKFVAQGAVITLLLYPFVILIILLFTPLSLCLMASSSQDTQRLVMGT